MCHFGSVYRRFLYVGSPLFRGNVVILPSCYLSFFDSCACVSVDCSCARVPVGLWTVSVPVCPCAGVPVDSSRARVPVCPEAREETYLQSLQEHAHIL